MNSHTRTSLGLFVAVAILAGRPAFAREHPADTEQARRVVDVRVPEEGEEGVVQRLTLTDGSQIFGRIVSIDGESFVFRSLAGVEMKTTRAEVADLRAARGRVVAGEFQPADSHNTRLLFAPTARALRKGEGYFGVYEGVLPFVQVGVTDRLSLGAGTPLFFGGGAEHPFWLTPKLQVLATDRAQAAVGIIHVTGIGENVGIAYGVTTIGGTERALSVGLGYGYAEGERAPIVMVGGEHRSSRRIKLVTENWLWPRGGGFLSGGVRFLGERVTADFGLMVPLIDEAIAFPLVSFAWHF